MTMQDVNRKMMLIGLFLSKFDRAGLEALGFSRFWEAYNTFALALGGVPKNINNYRDEFDPYFPNPRQGWKSRPLRPSRKAMMEKYADLTLEEFADLIRKETSFLGDADDIVAAASKDELNVSFAKRMMTGQSAENHFESHYSEISLFSQASLVRTTAYGCGFDFKLEIGSEPFFAVEVKGLGATSGSFQMTNKEYQVADYLRDRYFLYIVRGFETPKPFFTIVRDPITAGLDLQKHDVVSHQTFWTGDVTSGFASNCV